MRREALCVIAVFAVSATASALEVSRPQCDSWAAAGECTANPTYMREQCSSACRCHSWAAAGECANNPSYMRANCEAACMHREPSPPPPPPALTEADCATWAAEGECEQNADFMAFACATACVRAARRERCGEHACAGLPAPTPCGGGHNRSSFSLERNGTWPITLELQMATRQMMLPVAVVNDGAAAARLYWVDEQGREAGYGVAMPGGRSVLETWMGHHWRARDLETGELLREIHAQVLVARSCACGAHLTPRSKLLARLQQPGADASTPTALLVELRDPHSALVHIINRTDGAERLAGRLHPPGSRAPNATHQLLVSAVRAGDVITVRREATGETIMQHMAGDVALPRCSERAGTPKAAPPRTDADADAARTAAHASKAALLERRRDSVRGEVEAMRAALTRMRDVGAAETLDESTLREYAADARRAITRGEEKKVAAAAPEISPKAMSKGKAQPKRRGRKAKITRDELRA